MNVYTSSLPSLPSSIPPPLPYVLLQESLQDPQARRATLLRVELRGQHPSLLHGRDEIRAVGSEGQGPGGCFGGGHRAVGMHEIDKLLWSEGVNELGVLLHEQAVPPDVGHGEGGGGGETFDGAFDDAQALFMARREGGWEKRRER